ncbi:MAG: TSUP family transporter [Bacteroidota bacterium]|jgi:hypothetical protein
MQDTSILFLVLIGTIAGFLGGLLGIGGAVIIIPALVLILGFPQHIAQGTTLMMFVMPVGLLAAWQYYKAGNVDIKASVILALAFVISGYFGAKYAQEIPQQLLKKIFALLLMGISVKTLFFDK